MYGNGGYIVVVGSCGSCHNIFVFNPNKVPSLNDVPFCQQCVEMANPIRLANGLPLIVYDEDAYQPVREQDL